MGFDAINWAVRQRVGSPVGKLVLIELAKHADAEGWCWPSVATVAQDTELGKSAIYEWLGRFEEMGLAQPGRRAVGSNKSGREITCKAYQLAIAGPLFFRVAENVIPLSGKMDGEIPLGGKEIPLGGKEIPLGGKEIPGGGNAYKEESSLKSSCESSLNSEDGGSLSDGGGRREAILQRLDQRNGQTWLGDAEFIFGDTVQIIATTPAKANWIRTQFAQVLDKACPEGWSVKDRNDRSWRSHLVCVATNTGGA